MFMVQFFLLLMKLKKWKVKKKSPIKTLLKKLQI